MNVPLSFSALLMVEIEIFGRYLFNTLVFFLILYMGMY